MSRMLKPVIAGLAISSLCLSFVADLSAQNAAKKNKSAIRPAQAEDAQPRQRQTPLEDDNPQSGSAAAGKGARQPRPRAPEPLIHIEHVSPEVEEVLQAWESHTSRFKSMTASFTRFKYDKTFGTDTRAEGNVDFEAPDKGNYEFRGLKIEKGMVSRKVDAQGTPYTVKSEDPQRWVCNGKKVIRIDEKAKTYEEVTIPPESQGQNIIEGPLPFLFGMKVDRAKKRYRDFKLLNSKGKGEIKLQIRSKEKQDAANWNTAVIIIDDKEFIPKAVMLTDVTGAEIVHVFSDVKVNTPTGIFGRKPFDPNLWRYKQVVLETGLPPAQGAASIPATPPASSKQSKAAPPKGQSTK